MMGFLSVKNQNHWGSPDMVDYPAALAQGGGLHKPAHSLYLPCHSPRCWGTAFFCGKDFEKDDELSFCDRSPYVVYLGFSQLVQLFCKKN